MQEYRIEKRCIRVVDLEQVTALTGAAGGEQQALGQFFQRLLP
jgi:hypothetical protein